MSWSRVCARESLRARGPEGARAQPPGAAGPTPAPGRPLAAPRRARAAPRPRGGLRPRFAAACNESFKTPKNKNRFNVSTDELALEAKSDAVAANDWVDANGVRHVRLVQKSPRWDMT